MKEKHPRRSPATVSHAPLPVRYEAARKALTQCDRADECAKWANKAAALASYGRQVRDDELRKLAQRIYLRALRRAGELLREVECVTGRPPKNKCPQGQKFSKADAVESSGLTGKQRRHAVQIERIPAADFEAQVESDSPPSTQALAAQGVRPHKPKSPEYRAASYLLFWAEDSARELSQYPPALVVCGVSMTERAELTTHLQQISAWINTFTHHLEEADETRAPGATAAAAATDHPRSRTA